MQLSLVELDDESVAILHQTSADLREKIVYSDFFKNHLSERFFGEFSIIGNFPYNISRQILFKVPENKPQIKSVTGMVQREVGRRITAGPGGREYGILSVLMQAWYHAEYLFTVD